MSESAETRFFAWPGWPHLRYALCQAAVICLLFVVVYGGSSWITDQHAFRVRWNFDFERHTPFVPAMVLGYLSLNLLL